MTSKSELDPRIVAWLTEGPIEAPEHVIEDALVRARATRRPIRTGIPRWIAVRGSPGLRTWTAILVLVASLLVAGALLVGVGGHHDPPIPPPTAIPSPSAAELRRPTRNGPIAVGTSLRLIDPATGTSAPGIECPTCQVGDADWSPDGSTLIYTSPTLSSTNGAIANRQLQSWQIGATSPTVLWTCARLDCIVDSPAWSPNGRSIVLDAHDSAFTYSFLVVLAADGTNERQILPDGLRAVGFPSWTRDGRILFTAYWASDIRLAEVGSDGTGFRQLNGTDYPDGVIAAMSPDGSSIALLVDSFAVRETNPASPRPNNGIELWVEDADGTNARQIWYRPDCCISLGFGGPEWSPDGTKVAIVALSSPGSIPAAGTDIRLLSVDIASGQPTELGRADPARPAWQPVP
jgi:Tol biopolymer transport system component